MKHNKKVKVRKVIDNILSLSGEELMHHLGVNVDNVESISIVNMEKEPSDDGIVVTFGPNDEVEFEIEEIAEFEDDG